ncbi:MAG: hypothetical protein ACI391_02610 [Muribaculaceae bacterium]
MKRFFIHFFIAIAAFCASAQFIPSGGAIPSLGGSSVNLDFLREAIAKNVVVVRSQYIMADNNNGFYGFNNDSIFGQSFSIGIKSNGAILSYPSVAQPWDNDPNFAQYRNSDSYHPIICAIHLAAPAEAPTFVPYSSDSIDISQSIHNKFITLPFGTSSDSSLPFEPFNEQSLRGFIAWLSPASPEFGTDNTEVKISFSAPNLSFTDGLSSEIDDPSNGKAIAAFFIVPSVSDNGLIQLSLAGVVRFPANDTEKFIVAAISPDTFAADTQHPLQLTPIEPTQEPIASPDEPQSEQPAESEPDTPQEQ